MILARLMELLIDNGVVMVMTSNYPPDELYPNDQNKLRATGFLVRQYFLFNRNTWLDHFSFIDVRLRRSSSNLRPRKSLRGDGFELDDG